VRFRAARPFQESFVFHREPLSFLEQPPHGILKVFIVSIPAPGEEPDEGSMISTSPRDTDPTHGISIQAMHS